MVKMFDNVASLNLEWEHKNLVMATSMISCENEIMQFRQNVIIQGRVEDWMNGVLDEMRRSNR